ncbi:MAG: hypothetical protein NZ889_02775 [Candidatus Pacearchaeota archaeon]|nr:hypothetical protein [Candidatus Pacearchaeota archaeon]
MLQEILAVLISLSGYLVGIIIARATVEELKGGRKWFKLAMVLCLALIIISPFFFSGRMLFFFILVFVFIFLVVLASFIFSKKKKNVVFNRCGIRS